MPASPNRSAFETLKAVFDESALRCEACGYYDEDGRWTVETNGSSVVYDHVCPGCGITMTRTIEPGR